MALDYCCNCPELSEKYSNMPNDVLFHIFMRLSVKNLGRFRCVCKSWNSVISSPLFISHHHRNSTTQKSYIVLRSSIADPNPETWRIFGISVTRKEDSFSYAFYHPDNQRNCPFIIRTLCETLPFDFLPFRTAHPHVFTLAPGFQYQNDNLILIDAIHGVVCLASSLRPDPPTILWNPTIRKYVKILNPPPPFEIDDGYTHSLGFGFNSREDDFSLIRLWIPSRCLFGASTPLVYELFSIQQGTWRKIVGSEIRPGKFVSETGFFMNGTIHWLLSTHNQNQIDRLLMFDCEREEFKTMDLPQIFRSWGGTPVEIFKCQGMLSFVDCSGRLRLWAMEEYGVASSWKNLPMHRTYNDTGGMVSEESIYLMDAKKQAVSYAKKHHNNDENVYYEIDGKTCQHIVI